MSESVCWRGRRRLELGPDLVCGNNSVAFEDRIKLIGSKRADVIDGAGGPVNFNAVDLGGRAETEMLAQIVLR